MAAVREVNGSGIMLSGCGLLATVLYRPGFTPIYLDKLDIFVHRVRFARLRRCGGADKKIMVVLGL
jgi:hypothetical protein